MITSRLKLAGLLLLLFSLSEATLFGQWTAMTTPASYHHYSIETVTDDIIYAGGYGGALVRTTDGGDHWEAISIGNSDWVNQIHFFDTENGWLVTQSGTTTVNGHVMKSTDGGNTWTTVVNDASYSSMDWPSASVGYIGTWDGDVIKTTDGGNTWNAVYPPCASNVIKLQFINETTGFALNTDYDLLVTNTGGSSWTSYTHYGVRSFYFHDALNGFCVDSDGKIGRTTDGGVTFSFTEMPGYDEFKFNDISFFDQNHGYAVGGLDCYGGNCYQTPMIMSTNDGGASWTDYPNNPFEGQMVGFYQVDFTPNGTVFIAGAYSNILKNSSLVHTEENANLSTLGIYPNPNNGEFKLTLPENSSVVEIMDEIGRLVYRSKTIDLQMTLSLSHLSKGLYFVNVYDDSNQLLSKDKIVIQ